MEILYVAGNGYHCGCCRRSSKESYYADTVEDAIHEAIELDLQYEGDFSIHTIYGYDGDSSELESTIMRAIEQANKQRELEEKIEKLKSSITKLEQWFANLDNEKENKAVELKKLQLELTSLT